MNSDKDLKAAIMDRYDGHGTTGETAELVRIQNDGEVHAYGAMLGANHLHGWWLVGLTRQDA